jgi:SAM-dependent methyltransferase
MASVHEHYDDVLSPHYSRMFGEFEAKVDEQQALLQRLGVIAPSGDRVAVDLGCGPGFQSIALARLGFRVVAIDLCRRLLAELDARARGLPVESIVGDIRDVAELAPATAELIVCMGDTLSHLAHADEVERVFDGAARRLAVDGRLVLTFRDLSGRLEELDRFIPVFASDDLIMTCFLEYEPASVKVHDLIWVREPHGWRFRKGAYRKLRLGAEAVAAQLERAGFTVERHQAPAGMVALVGTVHRGQGRIDPGAGRVAGGVKTAR